MPKDEVLKKIEEAKDEDEIRAIEEAAIVETDKSLHDGDPEEQPDADNS